MVINVKSILLYRKDPLFVYETIIKYDTYDNLITTLNLIIIFHEDAYNI